MDTGGSLVRPSCSPGHGAHLSAGTFQCRSPPLKRQVPKKLVVPRPRGLPPDLFPTPSCTPPLPKPVASFQREAVLFLLLYFRAVSPQLSQ